MTLAGSPYMLCPRLWIFVARRQNPAIASGTCDVSRIVPPCCPTPGPETNVISI
ncbi:hypothetical protein FA13DRAFT_1725314 [Coprinellus micaceus]|uniref:Uncharacterized protein n=1 Tax=Coprinellus micaceus TaxID=71717 RepID=A0A4Y7TYS1_COPMI|nr:hypothetical protein FA13DRAFT_1725314 [Coprinellus micaceus]